MSLTLARRLATSASFLDPLSDRLQSVIREVPKSVRDALDGVWLGAPLHPALTDVPLGAWTTAWLLDVAGAESGAEAALAVGVVGALPAAATGLNDWSYLRGDSRRIGTVHAALNSSSLALNTASLVLRRRGSLRSARALSTLGYFGALFSAHLGGLLSFGLGVRVNRTAFDAPGSDWVDALDAAALEKERMRRVDVGGVPVLVVRTSRGEVCAIAARCTHLGGPLEEGERSGDVVTCPWHGSQFDLSTGEVVAGPAVFAQPSYECRERDGRIELRPRST